MAKRSKTLQIIASKLGMSEEDAVLSKAAEFERLLDTKSSTRNITETSKAIICLNLAADYYRADFDQKSAIKYSGLSGPSYAISKRTIENVLDLNNEKLTISSLCLTLQCSVQELAEQILEAYKKSSKMNVDMDLPHYVCMAVHQACRISKTKVAKRKLIEKSQLKPAQWSKLDAEWTKFTDDNFATVAKKKIEKPSTNDIIEDVQDMEITTEEEKMEPEMEPYHVWKRRMLEKAYRELGLFEELRLLQENSSTCIKK